MRKLVIGLWGVPRPLCDTQMTLATAFSHSLRLAHYTFDLYILFFLAYCYLTQRPGRRSVRLEDERPTPPVLILQECEPTFGLRFKFRQTTSRSRGSRQRSDLNIPSLKRKKGTMRLMWVSL
ncbi:hypothetical protein BC827DRAFT_1155305 [Russula dissimulans]|nr:hypothetical protein BC827DRAFT_1155305 [Russula dissimulans]